MNMKVKIGLFGARHSGKTCYCAAMCSRMFLGVDGFYAVPKDVRFHRKLYSIWDDLCVKGLPPTQDKDNNGCWDNLLVGNILGAEGNILDYEEEEFSFSHEGNFGACHIGDFVLQVGSSEVICNEDLYGSIEYERQVHFAQHVDCCMFLLESEEILSQEFPYVEETLWLRRFIDDMQNNSGCECRNIVFCVTKMDWLDVADRGMYFEQIVFRIMNWFESLFSSQEQWHICITGVSIGEDLHKGPRSGVHGDSFSNGSVMIPINVHVPIFYAMKTAIGQLSSCFDIDWGYMMMSNVIAKADYTAFYEHGERIVPMEFRKLRGG